MSESLSNAGAVDIQSARLDAQDYANNFAEMHPPLSPVAALVEADRCYFCYDAPCTKACPTGIDVAGFIRMIAASNDIGAARLILQENILGGTCARVCPTETLCEQACVRNDQDHRPVNIGLLQRHAVDAAMPADKQFFSRKPDSGKRIAIVGAGPAGLACAHGLAREGHTIDIFEARPKGGGLNEYGLAAYKMLDNFASHELQWLLAIGGIEIKFGQQLGGNLALDQLRTDYDAVFVGVGLGLTNRLRIADEDLNGVMDSVDYIADLRQSDDLSKLPVGRRVVVIGGGMTAIDIATQIKMLGADEVTLVYRRDQAQMNASKEEQEFAQTHGVSIRHNAQPHKLHAIDGQISGVEFERTETNAEGALAGTGTYFTLPADMLFKAIGQTLDDSGFADVLPETKRGRILVNADRQSSLDDVWAGGDCVYEGEDLTVSAVQDGKVAAHSIHQFLSSQS